MQINVIYDQSAGSLPSGFVAAVNYVVNYFDTAFLNAVTVNIDLGYGEVAGQSLGSGALGESETFFDSVAYSTAVNALKANQPSVTQQTAYSTLPGSSPLSGGTMWVSTAEEKALGLLAGNNSAIDGYVGLSSVYPFSYAAGVTPASNQYYFEGVLAHEFSEVLGRDSMLGEGLGGTTSYTPMDLFRYSGPGARQLGTGGPAYFSINGGTTNLDSWNTTPGGDLGDWASSAGADSFLAFSPSGQLDWISQADLSLMSVLGWDTTPSGPVVTVPHPTVQASSTAPIQMGTLFTETDAGSSPVVDLFEQTTSGGGHFVLNGVVEAVGLLFGVNASQISQLTFVPGAGSSDHILVGATDGTFSGWSNLQINGPTLTPVVTVPNSTVSVSSIQPIQMGTLFTATDAANAPIVDLFEQTTSGGGHFVLNGTVEPVGLLFGVNASQISQLTFVPGTGSSDHLLVGATDGVFSGWSNLQINGPTLAPPMVTLLNSTVAVSSTQSIQMGTLFTATDTANAPIVDLFEQTTAGGGHFLLNGVVEPVGQLFGVNASQISQLSFVAGTGSSDHLLVGATDGLFSGWSNLLINGPAAMAIAMSTFGPDIGSGAMGSSPTSAPGQSGPNDLFGSSNAPKIGGAGPTPLGRG